VKFRIIADSTQASSVGGNALPELLKLKLPNIEVKFKKDFPYVWNAAAGKPAFNHGATKGLNHHKGFSTMIDGRPDRLVTGSFNWSATADTKNYEDLTVYSAVDAATRRPVEQYTDEFAGFWNNSDAVLSPNDFSNFKDQQWNALMVANGKPASTFPAKPADTYPAYVPAKDDHTLDINGFRASDKSRLTTAIGSTLAKAVLSERTKAGRFASMAELLERVPKLSTLPPAKLETLFFGSGQVSINAATKEELDLAGFTPKQAAGILEYRAKNGDFESVDDLLKAGITQARLDGLRDILNATDLEGFFNSRAFSAPAGGTGYGTGGQRLTTATGADGVVSDVKASVTVGATDLFNKAKAGQAISVAMYGMNATAPEAKALIEAAKRGVSVRVVINDDFSESTVAALRSLKAQGLPIDIRVQSAKTMHEKFGVVGDDAFSGSANFSESSSTKHSEDRFTVKNHPEIAVQFQSQFELLWAKSKVVT
jgi:competence ComEA-like helix-hairpin-helix protein